MSKGNGGEGSRYYVHTSDDMSAFDRLPAPIRDALNYADFKIGAEACLEELRYHGANEAEVIRQIQAARPRA